MTAAARAGAAATLALTAAATLAACGSGSGAAQPSARRVAHDYVQASSRGDGARACALMTAKMRAATSVAGASCEQTIAALARRLPPGVADVAASATLTDAGSGAPGSVWVRIASGPFEGELITLQRSGGRWLVASQRAPQR